MESALSPRLACMPADLAMLAKLHTFSLLGIDALPVEVEVDVSPGALPKTVLVGLPEQAVKESTHRIERAMVNSGFVRPQDRVVINLAPAELPKSAGSFDLPIAVGILAGSGQFKSELFDQYAIVGELALDGSTRPVKGALSMAMAASRQHESSLRGHHRSQRERGRSGRRRRDRCDRRQQSRADGGVSCRRTRDRADALATRTNCFKSCRTTTKTSPTCAARRWPSGP